MTTTSSINGTKPVSVWRKWSPLILLLLAFWFVLVEGRLDGFLFAVPVLALAVAVRRLMPIPVSLGNINLLAFISFIPYFLWQSLLGGIDVAWRTLQPNMPIHPNIYTYEFRLKSDGARVFIAQAISLMPGTLTCLVGDHRLNIHVLSGSREQLVAAVTILEKRTARIFREQLEEPRHE